VAERPDNPDPPSSNSRRPIMKKLILAVALVVAFAAPALAQDFPQSYSQTR
jgi:hypothetical protein